MMNQMDKTALYYAKKIKEYCNNQKSCEFCVFARNIEGYEYMRYECKIMSDLDHGIECLRPEEWEVKNETD